MTNISSYIRKTTLKEKNYSETVDQFRLKHADQINRSRHTQSVDNTP